MKVNFQIEVHIYSDEALRDECYLEPGAPFGTLSPYALIPLRRNRNCEFTFQYSDTTTIKEALRAILQRIECDDPDILEVNENSIHFTHNGERYWVQDKNANLANLIVKYLDPSQCGIVSVQILVSADAGAAACEEGLRYFVHSHEAGKHNEPHIHVRDTEHEYEVSLAISDGRVLAGTMPRKMLKKAQKKIAADKAYFYNCWSTMTDGLLPDINHHYGYIQY